MLRSSDVPRPRRPHRRKWTDRILKAYNSHSAAVFSLSELPSSGINTLRSSARYLGLIVAIRTYPDRDEAHLYVLGARDRGEDGGIPCSG